MRWQPLDTFKVNIFSNITLIKSVIQAEICFLQNAFANFLATECPRGITKKAHPKVSVDKDDWVQPNRGMVFINLTLVHPGSVLMCCLFIHG